MPNTFHDAEDLRRYHRRLRKQCEYQRAYRERLKAAAVPDRDDIAKAALQAFLKITATDQNYAMMPLEVAMQLEAAGFPRKPAMERVKAMVRRMRKAS